ncbi:CPBP family intramembrane glutamic endopeptidase [Microbacterium sp. W4I20]|uniref:CPBP family intramembrane glutamic endopeptidase n=1 Tax=Microbacterium sp. W4I20 TaxID=3042262 RepID=UPI0027814351|nr:CPBP family glutamic-type intramembrane protease [Microbacterium sp. W4I20]MDQ0726994.1 MFS family permease [Microbacterium sp. W4I20]
MSTTQPRRRLFLKPRLWHIAPVLILFLLQAIVGGALVGALYARGDLVSGALLGLLVAAVFVGVIALTGWLPRILRERHRHSALWPALLVGGALLASFIASLLTAEWSGVAGSFILGAAIVALTDGLTEEVTFRGAVVVAARSRLSEFWVWMLSTVLFASTHFLSLTAGQSLGDTLLQVLFTFVAGTSFYVLRRAPRGRYSCRSSSTPATTSSSTSPTPWIRGGSSSPSRRASSRWSPSSAARIARGRPRLSTHRHRSPDAPPALRRRCRADAEAPRFRLALPHAPCSSRPPCGRARHRSGRMRDAGFRR